MKEQSATEAGPYQVFILLLCIGALMLLGVDVALKLDPGTHQILLYADTVLCAIFFFDFLHSLYKAPDRRSYMLRWGWVDLLSSIPSVGPLRAGRAARIVRVLRVLRGVRSARAIAQFVLARRAQSAALAVIFLALLLLVVSSIAILQFETAATSNITTADDAMWWAVTTMATVGYGDRYPVTAEGRLVAVTLMAGGVGIFGTFSGLVASWFLSPGEDNGEAERSEIRRLLVDLHAKVGASRPPTLG